MIDPVVIAIGVVVWFLSAISILLVYADGRLIDRAAIAQVAALGPLAFLVLAASWLYFRFPRHWKRLMQRAAALKARAALTEQIQAPAPPGGGNG